MTAQSQTDGSGDSLCHNPCCFIYFWISFVFWFSSFLWVFSRLFQFPSVPRQSPVPVPSPVLILLRCCISLIILSTVFSLQVSSQSLSDPRRLPRSLHPHGFPSEFYTVEFCCFSEDFSSSLVPCFLPALLWFLFSTINPSSSLLAPVRVCIWVLLFRLHRLKP